MRRVADHTRPLALVLLPGMDGTGALFEPFLALLPARLQARVISYPADATLGYAELLPFVRDRLPDGEPFVLLGESFSGPLALKIAMLGPPGLRAVVLSTSFARSPWPWLRHVLPPFLVRLVLRVLPASFLVRILAGPQRSTALQELVVRVLAAIPIAVLAARVRAVLAVDATRELLACPVPVLSLEAERDRVLPRRCARLLHEIRPDLRRVAIAGPHLLLQARPEAAAGALAGLLAEL